MKEQENRLQSEVNKYYKNKAIQQENCCDQAPDTKSVCCCTGPENPTLLSDLSGFSYSGEEINRVPKGTFMGLGCGNPISLSGLQPGETVLDLGCGGGFDCFLAAQQVGSNGRVIGVDMTMEMVLRARIDAAKNGEYGNIDFRLGELENLPVASREVNVIISNCVVNLSTDKPRVFAEAFRVLKPGGRLAIMDMLAKIPLPDHIRNNTNLYCGCISGAAKVDETRKTLADTGFEAIEIDLKFPDLEPTVENEKDPILRFVSPAIIKAVKPQS